MDWTDPAIDKTSTMRRPRLYRLKRKALYAPTSCAREQELRSGARSEQIFVTVITAKARNHSNTPAGLVELHICGSE